MTAPARVTVTVRPLWRLRLGPALTANLVRAAAVAGLLASARYALDPPRAQSPRPVTAAPADLAAQGYATVFARSYLTWDAANPDAHRRALGNFAGAELDPDVGMRLPASGRQSVTWAQVMQSRSESPREQVYTVAAALDSGALLYLTVPVLHPPGGPLSLAGYPALVGPPAQAPGQDVTAALRDVSDPQLSAVGGRALGNYLTGAASDLEADLSTGARISLPPGGLSLERVSQLKWSPDGASVLAAAQVAGPGGAVYTLTYELDVVRVAGRWEVSAIEMDPYA